MSTIKDVTALFKQRTDELLPIVGKPTNNDLEILRNLLCNLLQAVNIPEGTNDEGLITIKVNYKAAHVGSTFDRLDMLLQAYDTSIPSDAITNNRMQSKHKWTAKLFRKLLLRATECGARTLILGDVDDTWVRCLKNSNIYYNKVPPRDITNHLATNSGGLEKNGAVDLQQAKIKRCRGYSCVTEYGNILWIRKKKAVQASLPIPNE